MKGSISSLANIQMDQSPPILLRVFGALLCTVKNVNVTVSIVNAI
jgi:hypothetical protein